MDGSRSFNMPWMGIIVIFGILVTRSTSQALDDVVANSGSTVTFTYSGDTFTSTDSYTWNIFNPQPSVIYQSNDQSTSNPSKYSVTTNGPYNLTIATVTKDDARTYCLYSSKTKQYSCGNLLVVDSLTPSVNPPNDASVGQLINLTCILQYGSPTTDKNNVKPLTSGQTPQLSMYVGSNLIPTSQQQQIIGTDESSHSISISANYTVTQNDGGQSLVCTMTTTSPFFNISAPTSLNVRSPVNGTTIIRVNSTSSSCCAVGEILNCTAKGYPYPIFTWKNLPANDTIPTKSGETGFQTLQITRQGAYTLLCLAENTVSSVKYASSTTIDVNTGASNTSQATGDNNNVGLGVGIGVGIGVPVLIGVIILIVILSRRKKAAKPISVKQPEKTGKAPVNNGKGPDTGPRNNVNPNPNPTYYTPIMPEQAGNGAPKNVRDSPGYGDLGVRHIGGSGSNPHLNESFDSQADKSFDSSNRRSGGNLQFVGGKTNHSPSAPNTSV